MRQTNSSDYTEIQEVKSTASKSNGCSKVTIMVLVAIGIMCVIFDFFQKGCVLTEKEQVRAFRVACGGYNGTDFTCDSLTDHSWTKTITDNDQKFSCTKPSSCANFGITYFLNWIEENPLLGAIGFIILYIAACVLFIPGSLLTVGAGVAYGAVFNVGIGVMIGTLCVWLGSNMGAAIAFLLGRYLFRDWVANQLKKYEILSAVDRAIQTQGFKAVLLLRLSPLIPFNVFNYTLGATSVSFRSYVGASLCGMLPATIAYVFIGAVLGNATSSTDLASCNPDHTLQNIILGVGIVATFGAVGVISFYAKKELNTILDEGGDFSTINKVEEKA